MTRPNLSLVEPIDQLPPRPRIVYTRKSSEAEDAQARSHEQQLAEILPKCPDGFAHHFKDDKSGKTFDDRPGFQAMLRWCQLHPQPRTAPGTVVMYDKSRFARALIPGTQETDWLAYDEARIAFAKAGWELEFVKSRRTGNQLVDRILSDLDDDQSSDYLRRLSYVTRRGQEHAVRNGYWPRGRAPFPCARVEAETGRALPDAVLDEAGTVVQQSGRVQRGAHVVLAPDPEKVAHWNVGARMIVERRPWREVVGYFDRNVPTAKGTSRWALPTLLKVYTCRALVGVQCLRDGGKVAEYPANWAPIVDPKLFEAVQAEIARRRRTEGQRSVRRADSTYIVRNLRCALCGAKYHGRLSYGRRNYYHPSPDSTFSHLDRQTEARCREHGCRQYQVRADEVEGVLRDLILKERGSPDWAATMRRLFQESAAGRGSAVRLVQQMEKRVREAEAALDANFKALDRAKGPAVDLIVKRIEEKHDALAAARRDLDAAHARVKAAGAAAEQASQMLTETLQIARAWDSQDPAARQRILDWWIDAVYVMPHQRPSTRRAVSKHHAKTLLVWLATTPDEPKEVPLQEPAVKTPSACGSAASAGGW